MIDQQTGKEIVSPADRIADTPRRRDIGFGVYVTEGVDGVFLHFTIPGGGSMGFCVDETSTLNLLGRERLHRWALMILDGHESLRPLE